MNLPPGTYYLVLSNFSPNFAWDFVGGGATEVLGVGVTSNPDLVDLATPTPAFPPSATTFVGASAGGSSRVLLFSVTGNPGAVIPPITLSKAFGAVAIPVGGQTTLTFTIANTTGSALTTIAFQDVLVPALQVASPNGLAGSCLAAGGTITAIGNVISATSLTLAAGASCTLTVNVTGVAEGAQSNTTSLVTGVGPNGPVIGALAIAGVFVGAALLISYASNLNVGE